MIIQAFQRKLTQVRHAHPSALYVLLSAEIPELMGRFGIMATLVLYLTHILHMTDTQAFAVYGTYLTMSYVTPILGGYLADHALGYYRSVMLGAFLMVIGNLCLIVPQIKLIYLGLSLMAIGVGFFSPSLVALVNALYQDKDDGREQAFVLYYICRNVGALIAPTVCGIIGLSIGYEFAFLFTAVCMMVGLLIFFLGKNHLPGVALTAITTQSAVMRRLIESFQSAPVIYSIGSLLLALLIIDAAFVLSLSVLLLTVGAIAAVYVIARLYRQADRQQYIALHAILLSIAFMIVFFSINQLCGASFNLFVDRLVDRTVFGVELPTSVFFSINPLFMIVCGGFFMSLINRIKRPNVMAAAFTKYSLALLIFSMAMLVLVFAAQQAQLHQHASGLFIVLCYSLCALSELCIVPIVIALIGRLSPVGQVGTMMGVYQFGNAIASYITTHIANVAAVNFPLTSEHALHRAAGLYHHIFSELTLVLLLAAVMAYAARFIFKRSLVIDR